MQQFSKKKVLVCPLDWGLGHATRCIPLIHQLLQYNAEVVIAAAPSIEHVLKEEFPQLAFIDVFGYEVHYSKTVPVWFKLGMQAPRLFSIVKKEQEWLEKIIDQHKPDVVISDNRYGLYSTKVHCIFITHQLFIPAPVLQKFINKKNHAYIRKFNECWIPDYESDENLSGKLAHGKHALTNVKYIGPLSRFNLSGISPEKRYDYCVLLSGIEPQRSLLERKLIGLLNTSSKKTVFIRGIKNPSHPLKANANTEVIDFLSSSALQEKIEQSECIICRSGYSSIMDLDTLQKKAMLIPTPGQAEQEYLAGYLCEKKGWRTVKQSQLRPGLL